MKLLLLSVVPIALLASDASAQSSRVKTEPERAATVNYYRAVPRESLNVDPNKRQNLRMLVFKPTQFYYTRDTVISYRYSATTSFSGGVEADGYLGPHGAAFYPDSSQLAAGASLRNLAYVSRRSQPGVGMAPATPVAPPTTKKKPAVTSIERPAAKVAANVEQR